MSVESAGLASKEVMDIATYISYGPLVLRLQPLFLFSVQYIFSIYYKILKAVALDGKLPRYLVLVRPPE